MNVLAYITDLFFQAKVGQTAKAAGADLKIVSSLYHFLPALQKNPSMVLIDLRAEGISPSALIAQIKGKTPDLPVIVYAAHTDTELIERAKRAGADEVMSKAELSEELPDLLKRFMD